MLGETLRAFEHSINSETQLSVIRQHTAHADRQLRELCTGWTATADGQSGQIRWKTTENIQRWKKFSKLQPGLLCATVVKPLRDLDHWGILYVLCVLLPQLAPDEDETKVVMPQTKALIYHLSTELRAAVFGILCKPANWQLALDLIARDGQLMNHQY